MIFRLLASGCSSLSPTERLLQEDPQQRIRASQTLHSSLHFFMQELGPKEQVEAIQAVVLRQALDWADWLGRSQTPPSNLEVAELGVAVVGERRRVSKRNAWLLGDEC